MQKLEIYQSLWAMELRQPGKSERSAEQSFEMIAAAGFAGVCIDPAVDEIPDMLKLKPLFAEHSLRCMVNAFPGTVDELKPLLQLAGELDASLVNVIGGVMPLTVEDGIPVVQRWMDDARRAELPLLFETHRDSLLNDLHYTLQLIDAIPEMRLCADLSHFVLDREMPIPLSATNREHINRILDRADCFQGRISNREQIQVQIDFAQHQPWVDLFKDWWLDGMRLWQERNTDDSTLPFLCELGPPSYAMTDQNGLELSDRWDESLTIKSWIEDLWESLSRDLTRTDSV
jgi:hypothetical protein